MILLSLAAAAAAVPPAPVTDQSVYAQCAAAAKDDPAAGVDAANAWLVRGGGMFARECLGLAYTGLKRWAPASTVFQQAAEEAEVAHDDRRADFWVQAGNGWLAAGDADKARQAFDAALATAALSPELRGEVTLDRGRADVALGDVAAARADFDNAEKLVPNDPFAWYMSSALALRQSDLPRAQDDIAEALRLAPDEPDLLVHAGNVAGMSGELDAARGLFGKAIRLAPKSDAAARARAALAANADPAPAPKPAASPPK